MDSSVLRLCFCCCVRFIQSLLLHPHQRERQRPMGTSDVMDWNLESITKRDIRVSDEVVKIMNRWNNEYLNISISEGKMGEPSEEELAQIEKFKKNGWI